MAGQSGVKFIYLFCADLARMRHFYSELLGLEEIYYVAGEDGGLGYNCDGLQFTIFQDERVTPQEEGWARQPGWQGGTLPMVSWSVPYKEGDYRSVLARLRAAGVTALHDKPQWVHYWSYPVKDPMGNTVEIVLPLDEAPADTAWTEDV